MTFSSFSDACPYHRLVVISIENYIFFKLYQPQPLIKEEEEEKQKQKQKQDSENSKK